MAVVIYQYPCEGERSPRQVVPVSLSGQSPFPQCSLTLQVWRSPCHGDESGSFPLVSANRPGVSGNRISGNVPFATRSYGKTDTAALHRGSARD